MDLQWILFWWGIRGELQEIIPKVALEVGGPGVAVWNL